MTVNFRLMILTALATLVGLTGLYAAANQHTKTFKFFPFFGGLPDGTVVNGSSVKLTRAADSIWIRVNTTGLLPGAHTNWWVIFNHPEACAGGCGEDDFFRPDVDASVLFATGGVVGANGVGHFDAHLDEGAPPGEVLFGPSLTNAEGAEVHYVIRYHGPLVPTIAAKQLTTFAGGCAGAGQEDPVPADRIFPCYDPQAAVIPAP
jgi:hypothetical protein